MALSQADLAPLAAHGEVRAEQNAEVEQLETSRIGDEEDPIGRKLQRVQRALVESEFLDPLPVAVLEELLAVSTQERLAQSLLHLPVVARLERLERDDLVLLVVDRRVRELRHDVRFLEICGGSAEAAGRGLQSRLGHVS